MEPLVKAQVLTPVLTFAADPQSGALQTVQPAANAFLLAECAGRLPEAYVLDSWRGGLDVTNQLAALAQADWDPAQQAVTDAPAVAGGTRQAHMIGQARVISRRRHDFCFATRILTDAPQAGLLIVNEAYDAGNLEAHLDDRVVPLHRANALWCAVEVPAGSHTISIRHSWQPVWPLASALAGLAMGLWGLLRYSLSNGL